MQQKLTDLTHAIIRNYLMCVLISILCLLRWNINSLRVGSFAHHCIVVVIVMALDQNDSVTIWYFKKDQNIGISLKKVRCGHQNLLYFVLSSSWGKARLGLRQFSSSRRMMVKIKYAGAEESGTNKGSSPFLGGEQSKSSPGEQKPARSGDLLLFLSLPYPSILLLCPPLVCLNVSPHPCSKETPLNPQKNSRTQTGFGSSMNYQQHSALKGRANNGQLPNDRGHGTLIAEEKYRQMDFFL